MKPPTRSNRAIPSRASEIILCVMLLIVLLGLLAAGYILSLSFHEKARTIISARLTTALEHQVDFQRLSFSPFRGISLHQLEVKDDSASGFLLQCPRLDIMPGLEIFTGKLAIKRTNGIAPILHIERGENGHFNFNPEKFMTGLNAALAPAQDHGLPFHPLRWPITIDGAKIILTGTTLNFKDAQGILPGLSGLVDLFVQLDFKRPQDFLEVKVRLDQTSVQYGTLNAIISGQAQSSPERTNCNIDIRLPAGTSLNLLGSLRWDHTSPAGTLVVTGKEFPLASLIAIGQPILPALEHFRVTGELMLDRPTVNNITLPSLRASFDLQPDKIAFSSLDILLPNRGRINGDITLVPQGDGSAVSLGVARLTTVNAQQADYPLWQGLESLTAAATPFADEQLNINIDFEQSPPANLLIKRLGISAGPLTLKLTGQLHPLSGNIDMQGDYTFPQTLLPFQQRNSPPEAWRTNNGQFSVLFAINGELSAPLFADPAKEEKPTTPRPSQPAPPLKNKTIYPNRNKIKR